MWLRYVNIIIIISCLTLLQAGLCSREYCPALKEVHNYTPEHIEEEKPDKLSLALEPESAAIFCQYMSQKQRFNSDWDFDKKSTNYLIVDIGGGTVDISAHCLVRDPEPHIRVIHPPTGNNYGGTQVNEKFKQFLKDMVKDPGFDRFVSTNDQVINSRNQFILDLLLKEKFELQKKVFEKNDKNYKGVIELPSAFFKTYEHDLMQSILDDDDSTVELVDQDLRLSHKVMSSFFKDVVKGIIQCIRETLKEVGNIKYIYLVGGFGGTQYVEKVLKDEFDKDSIKCIVPVEPAYAVVRGAALFKLNPNVIECRKVDATYGIKTNIAFKTGLHDPKYRWMNDDNQLRCDSIFKTVVQKGDIVGTGEVFLMTFHPACHNQKSMLIIFYSSQDTDIFYVTGEWGIGKCEPRHTVTKIGQIMVEMPVPDGDKKRGVDVMFSFSHTEIKVRAFDKTSKTEVKVVFDFLTTK